MNKNKSCSFAWSGDWQIFSEILSWPFLLLKTKLLAKVTGPLWHKTPPLNLKMKNREKIYSGDQNTEHELDTLNNRLYNAKQPLRETLLYIQINFCQLFRPWLE